MEEAVLGELWMVQRKGAHAAADERMSSALVRP